VCVTRHCSPTFGPDSCTGGLATLHAICMQRHHPARRDEGVGRFGVGMAIALLSFLRRPGRPALDEPISSSLCCTVENPTRSNDPPGIFRMSRGRARSFRPRQDSAFRGIRQKGPERPTTGKATRRAQRRKNYPPSEPPEISRADTEPRPTRDRPEQWPRWVGTVSFAYPLAPPRARVATRPNTLDVG